MNIRKYEKRKMFLILLEYMFRFQSLRFENTNTTTEMVFSFLFKKEKTGLYFHHHIAVVPIYLQMS